MKLRMSEQYFNLQGRINTVVSFVIILGITALLLWGTGYIIPQPIAVTQQQIIPIPKQLPQIIPDSLASYNHSRPKEEAYVQKESEPVLKPLPSPSPQSTTLTTLTYNNSYYLQLGAFEEEARAWRQRHWLSNRHNRPVYVAVSPLNEIGKYKVLMGPFKSKKAAENYRIRHHLEGWPKHLEGLELIR